MEPQGSLSCSQEPATCPYKETDLSSSCLRIHLFKMPFNVIPSSLPSSFNRSDAFRFPHQYASQP